MKRTKIYQIMRTMQFIPLCLIAFSFVSCSDDGDDTYSVSESDDGYDVSGTISGHYYVDLGLSVKWATCNVGADSPEDYGDYFAWGETEPKDDYSSSTSVTYGVVWGRDISGDATYDAAKTNWGSKWRMPTYDEFEELLHCTSVITTCNGSLGLLITGTNGNSIFFPSAGFFEESTLYYGSSEGYYWTSTPIEENNIYSCAYGFHFVSSGKHLGWSAGYRYWGFPVRPVSE